MGDGCSRVPPGRSRRRGRRVALVDGAALGGGYETALAHDFVLAQEDVPLGFPEIGFNLFPGMGGYSLAARRASLRVAERLIGLGERHPAAWHEEQGLVDRVVAPGTGHAATVEFIESLRPRLNGIRAMLRTRKRVFPVTRLELMEITEDWAETALGVGDAGIARMEDLLARQEKRFVSEPPA